jgi:hypothetical protein
MEPVAVRLGLWRWTPPGGWLGIPVGNFVGWAVIVAGWGLGTERGPFAAPLARVAARRAALAAVSIAALLLVGFAWRASGAERAAGPVTGWLIAGAVCVLALLLTGRRRPAIAWPDTLAGRLGGTPGLAPEMALLVLVLAFAADAVALGEGDLRVVAAMAVGVVGFVAVASGRFGLSDAWRSRALQRFAGVRGFVHVLMKPPNGEPWTADDRDRLRRELRALARWTPGFVLFLLPGGLVLLIVYAHLLDRRRLKRPADCREGEAPPPCPVT